MEKDDRLRAYLLSRLSNQDCASFEDDLARDPTLRADVAAMAAVQQAFVTGGNETPEHGWGRLSDKIDEESHNSEIPDRNFSFHLLQVACIALTAFLSWQVLDAILLSDRQDIYFAASGENAERTLQIEFNSLVTLAAVTDALVDLQGKFVDGPNAIGLYIVAFTDRPTRDTALDILMERGDLVIAVSKPGTH